MKILEAHNKVAEKTEIYVPYNILPLDPDSSNQAIMKYPEVGFWISSAVFLMFLNSIFYVSSFLPWFLIFRFKLLFLHLETPGVFHGQRATRRK